VNDFCHKREELMPEFTHFNTLMGLAMLSCTPELGFL